MIFVDLDGTLTEFEHKNSVILENWFEYGIFSIRLPVKPMIDKLSKMTNRLAIMSVAPSCNAIKEKNEWLDKHAPFITERYYVGDPKRKVQYMNAIVEKEGLKRSDCILIDDTHEILVEAEQAGYYAMHTSTFLAKEEL